MTETASTSPADADDRSRQQRGNARRQAILDAAVELFAARGSQGTGVAALADEVGMTAPGLLYYFGTKERLLREVVSERDRTELSDLDSLEGAGLRSLRGLGRANQAHATMTRLYVRLGAENLDADDPLHDFFARRYASGRQFVAGVIRDEQARGIVSSDVDVEQTATEVIATLMGLEIQWLHDPSNIDLDAVVDKYFDRLADELAP